jgi:hypothetical protein
LDSLDHEFKLLAASAERTARVQLAEVTGFIESAPRHPTTGYRQADYTIQGSADHGPRRGFLLAQHLRAAYDSLIAHIKLRSEDYEGLPDTESRSGAVTEMRQMVVGARNLHRSLGWLDAARNPPLDLGTRYLVDDLAASLVDTKAEVTVVAATDKSYATVTNPLRLVCELSGVKPLTSNVVIVVFVPRREQQSGLLHPLIVHELGHASNKQHDLVRRVFDTPSGQTELSTVLRTVLERAVPEAGGMTEDTAAAVDAAALRLSAWVEEALCDAIATHILGPTYLYSFMAIVGTSDLSTAGAEHPATRQRIRLIVEQLDELGWAPLMAEAAPQVDAWFREMAGEVDSHEEHEIALCTTALANLVDTIRGVVAGHIEHLTLEADNFGLMRAEIDGLLRVGVPPSQTRTRSAIGRAEIILGSWLFAVGKQGGDLGALAVAADVPELSRLLRKALQDAAVLAAGEPS